MSTYRSLELKVLEWAQQREILRYSTPLAQAIKTTEEVAELLKALSRGDLHATKDAYADIMITLIIGADIAGVDLVECLGDGYEVIRHRTGRLTADGIFVKDS